MQRAGTIAILVITAIVIPLYLWLAIEAVIPQPSFGMAVTLTDGSIRNVTPQGPADLAGVKFRDRVLDLPRGNAIAGFRELSPRVGDALHVATAHGVAIVRAERVARLGTVAITTLLALLSALLLVAFATLLCVRRPGMMSFALWLYAVTSIPASAISPLFVLLPPALGLSVWMPLYGLVAGGYAVPAIPFALRFPSGTLRNGERWGEAAAWLLFWTLNLSAAHWVWAVASGATDQFQPTWWSFGLPIVPLPIAAAILLWRYLRSSALVRAQTAWALAGFGISIVAQTVGPLSLFFIKNGPNALILDALLTIANIAPLLAIYPIFRHKLFDLGFVVNRATLYSVLTLAAVGTLAGVNWIAQHFITERLATLLQPIAAIAIGFGYMRVRGWVQSILERTIFRERFAAEAQLEETMKTFASADNPEIIDAALTSEAASVLSLQSASVLRAGTAPSAILENGDVVAIELQNGNERIGTAYYGPHINGTEIDPEELRLLRRLCDAAAAAYRNAELQSELLQLRARIAVLEAGQNESFA